MQTASRNNLILAIRAVIPTGAVLVVMDDDYTHRSSHEDVMRTWRAFQRAAWAAGLIGWRANSKDCDDYAWWFRGFAIAQWAKLTKETKALPIGIVRYTDAMLGRHWINVEVMEDGSLMWIEPQKPGGGIRSLSHREIMSIDAFII